MGGVRVERGGWRKEGWRDNRSYAIKGDQSDEFTLARGRKRGVGRGEQNSRPILPGEDMREAPRADLRFGFLAR